MNCCWYEYWMYVKGSSVKSVHFNTEQIHEFVAYFYVKILCSENVLWLWSWGCCAEACSFLCWLQKENTLSAATCTSML